MHFDGCDVLDWDFDLLARRPLRADASAPAVSNLCEVLDALADAAFACSFSKPANRPSERITEDRLHTPEALRAPQYVWFIFSILDQVERHQGALTLWRQNPKSGYPTGTLIEFLVLVERHLPASFFGKGGPRAMAAKLETIKADFHKTQI
jgi:hypothetical protein